MNQNILYIDFTFLYKIDRKYFFPSHSGRKRTTDPFYPAWGKMGHFSDVIWIDIFRAYSLVFVLNVHKHGLKCSIKALKFIKNVFKKYSEPVDSRL